MLRSAAGKLRLLLIASGCDCTDVGEAWSSFHWVNGLAKIHDITLLSFRKRDRPSVSSQLPGVRVIEWLDLPVVGRWERFNSMLKPGYMNFYVRSRRWVRQRLRSGESFDLVHQISPLALRYPSPAVGLGIPLVIGPLGGSLDDPKSFHSELKNAPWYTKLRLLDEWRLLHDPILRRSFASADCLICVAPYVKTLLGDLPSGIVEFISETGVLQLPGERTLKQEKAGPLRLLFVGRVIRTKGVRDAIRAISKLTDLELSFDVVGGGDDLLACQTEAQSLGVAHRVTFHGRIPRKEVDKFYAAADIFLFPSFREPSGNAVIEAMSHGLAIIVADRGGPGFVVDDGCGIRVPVTEPEEFATQIAGAVRRLALNPDLVSAMRTGARAKVKSQFLWDAKIARLGLLYDRVLANRDEIST
jgi:glycosyltransferase involved in cell wall biosynthesis